MLSERPMDWTHRLFNRARSSRSQTLTDNCYCYTCEAGTLAEAVACTVASVLRVSQSQMPLAPARDV